MAIRPGLGYGGLYAQPFLDADGRVSTGWYDFLQALSARANTEIISGLGISVTPEPGNQLKIASTEVGVSLPVICAIASLRA